MYKFKSRAGSDLLMLEPQGRQILAIIGKEAATHPAQGILVWEDMPAAIAALEQAVAHDEARRAQAALEAQAEGLVARREEGISLRQRAIPFIAMLQQAHRAQENVVWGV